MFKILGRTAGNLVDVAVDGTLSADDFAALRDKIGPLIDSFGKVRLLFDLSSFEDFEGEGLWDEQTFGSERPVERVALVVDERKAADARRVFGLDAEAIRTFPPDEAKRAWSWLTERDAGAEEAVAS